MTQQLRFLRPQSSPYAFANIVRSDQLFISDVPKGESVRSFYLGLKQLPQEPGPVLAVSPFVPMELADHLMHRKRNLALASKWINAPTAEITNMEGALHTYVTAIVPIKMHGDYVFRNFHNVPPFPFINGFQQYRQLLLSTAIHPDFETEEVMIALTSLGDEEIVGKPLSSADRPSPEEKRHTPTRGLYDSQLRSHMVYHLTSTKKLPTLQSVKNLGTVWTLPEVIDALEVFIRAPPSPEGLPDNFLANCYLRTPFKKTLSLELLLNGYVSSLVNEFSVLEAICSSTGYAYTFSPPSIFAYTLDATVLNRLMILALRVVAENNILGGMKIFGFSDYADKDAVGLIKCALRGRPHIKVVSRDDVYSDEKGRLSTTMPELRGLAVVIHNNSDAFGQNIETEGCTSLDGAVGCFSSAAAGLHRSRKDLLSCII